MTLHIGEKIKARAKELRIGPTELSRMINTSKQNVYGIYKRKTVDTELLRKLSNALQFDFFRLYTGHEVLAFNDGTEPYKTTQKDQAEKSLSELENQLEIMRKELVDLKEKNELLKRLNTLLEKGIKK